MNREGIPVLECTPEKVAHVDCSIIVGLWDSPCAAAVHRLLQDSGEVIVVPTVYWNRDLLADCARPAAMMWYVSWDQAVEAQSWWHHARRIEVVRCAVDTDRFRRVQRPPIPPWVLCRHSRDTAEKFASDTTQFLEKLNRSDIIFNVLGGLHSLRHTTQPRIRLLAEGSISPEIFLQNAHVWVYSHAPWWRETACISMLEAMASSLPVVVTSAGGMREYLVHNRTGFACAAPHEFPKFTSRLLENPDLLDWMSDQARNWVVEHHSIEAMTKRLRQLL
jgi:glycosyltransferase involved in cell wall biosynthesis